MTKHADEIAVKSHLGLDNVSKVVENNTEAICDEALVVCDATVKRMHETTTELITAKTMVKPLRSNADKAMEKLHDLERSGEPEKPLNVDLDLYQMENY